MDIDEFRAAAAVSRETAARLMRFGEMLAKWNPRINLVAPASLKDMWERHFLDSAQLFPLAPTGARHWLDLGSGAGFPGLVVATMAAEKAPELRVTLVESDGRKSAFLAQAAREMGIEVTIRSARIQSIPAMIADVVSARALAPLGSLCGLAARFGHPETVFLFPKGRNLDSELTEARQNWHIRAERIPSRTSPDAAILRITELAPKA